MQLYQSYLTRNYSLLFLLEDWCNKKQNNYKFGRKMDEKKASQFLSKLETLLKEKSPQIFQEIFGNNNFCHLYLWCHCRIQSNPNLEREKTTTLDENTIKGQLNSWNLWAIGKSTWSFVSHSAFAGKLQP